MEIGEQIKELRLEHGLSLRAFCIKYDMDPIKWSRMERGILPNGPKVSDEDLIKKLPVFCLNASEEKMLKIAGMIKDDLEGVTK
jgi:transcriptional regulator with XRE-family HTH domain